MPEPIDAIMPVLQRIQADIADSKRDLGDKIDRLSAQAAENTQKLDAVEQYIIYRLGLTSKNSVDVETLHPRSRIWKPGLPPPKPANGACSP